MSNLISIIVLNWNRKAYSTRTIENLLKKTSLPHEFIFVNNNSTKESGIAEYLDSVQGNVATKKITVIHNKKNLGVAAGRNSGLKIATGKYLVTIDDDVIVPDNWDVHITAACNSVTRLGITGINVESAKYPVKVINGVRIRPKSVGNLGGACLCIPRRVFERVGYYSVFGQYGLEDSDMFVRLTKLGLMSAYIEPHGIHLDDDSDRVYRAIKNRAHKKRSSPLNAFSKAKAMYEKTGAVYVPYTEYDPDDPKWAVYERFDGSLSASSDVYEVFKKYSQTAELLMGNKIDISKINESTYLIDTGASSAEVDQDCVCGLMKDLDTGKVSYAIIGDWKIK